MDWHGMHCKLMFEMVSTLKRVLKKAMEDKHCYIIDEKVPLDVLTVKCALLLMEEQKEFNVWLSNYVSDNNCKEFEPIRQMLQDYGYEMEIGEKWRGMIDDEPVDAISIEFIRRKRAELVRVFDSSVWGSRTFSDICTIPIDWIVDEWKKETMYTPDDDIKQNESTELGADGLPMPTGNSGKRMKDMVCE